MIEQDLNKLMARNGVEVIGAAQRTIAFTAVADAGNGFLEITAAGHGLKNRQTIYFGSGFYAGIYAVRKIVSSSKFWIKGEFGATTSGNINLTASLDGAGFFVTTSPTIAELELEDPTIDPAAVIARVFAVGESFNVPFKKIRITAGNLTVVRGHIKAELDYDRFDPANEDNAGPVLSTAVVTDVADTSIVLTYTDTNNLDALRIPAASSFAISGVASTPTITAVAINASAKTITLTLSAAVVQTDVPLLDYTPGANAIRDSKGNLAAAFVDQPITNTVITP